MRTWLLLIVVAAGVSSCGQAASFEVDGTQFLLEEHAQQCRLILPSRNLELDLLIPWPCQVHRDTNGNVRVYAEAGSRYLLLESSVPHPDLPKDCLTQLQAVVIQGDEITLSESKDTVASCPPFQWDTKVFTGMFSDRKE